MGGRGSGAVGVFLSVDEYGTMQQINRNTFTITNNPNKRNPSGGLFDYAQSDIIVRTTLDRNPFGGLAPERARLESHIIFKNRLPNRAS